MKNAGILLVLILNLTYLTGVAQEGLPMSAKLSDEDLVIIEDILREDTTKLIYDNPSEVEYYLENPIPPDNDNHSVIAICAAPVDNKLLNMQLFRQTFFKSTDKTGVLVEKPTELKYEFADMKKEAMTKLENNQKFIEDSKQHALIRQTLDDIKLFTQKFPAEYTLDTELPKYLINQKAMYSFINMNPDSSVYFNTEEDTIHPGIVFQELQQLFLSKNEELKHVEADIKSIFLEDTQNFVAKLQKLEQQFISLYQAKEVINQHQKEVFEYMKGESEYTIMVREVMAISANIEKLKNQIENTIKKDTNIIMLTDLATDLTIQRNQVLKQLPKAFSNKKEVVDDRSEIKEYIDRFKQLRSFVETVPYDYPCMIGLQTYLQGQKENYRFVELKDSTVFFTFINGQSDTLQKPNMYDCIKKDVELTYELFKSNKEKLAGHTDSYKDKVRNNFQNLLSQVNEANRKVEFYHLTEVAEEKEISMHNAYFPEGKRRPEHKRIYKPAILLLKPNIKNQIEAEADFDTKIGLAKKMITLYDKMLFYASVDKDTRKTFEKELKRPYKDENIQKLTELFEL